MYIGLHIIYLSFLWDMTAILIMADDKNLVFRFTSHSNINNWFFFRRNYYTALAKFRWGHSSTSFFLLFSFLFLLFLLLLRPCCLHASTFRYCTKLWLGDKLGLFRPGTKACLVQGYVIRIYTIPAMENRGHRNCGMLLPKTRITLCLHVEVRQHVVNQRAFLALLADGRR